MSAKQEKKIVRTKIKELKQVLPNNIIIDYSKSVFYKIENLEIFKQSTYILIYWSLPHEVQTNDFILKWHNEKKFVLPVVVSNDLILKKFSGISNMKKSSHFGIYEPTGKPFTDYKKINMAIIPGIAFDKKNNRLGYGKGYYDRLLPKINAFKTGVCFDFQYFSMIPNTTKDIKMDLVITN